MVHLLIDDVLEWIKYGIVKWNKRIIENRETIYSYFCGKQLKENWLLCSYPWKVSGKIQQKLKNVDKDTEPEKKVGVSSLNFHLSFFCFFAMWNFHNNEIKLASHNYRKCWMKPSNTKSIDKTAKWLQL